METHPPTVTPLITPGLPDENGDPVLDLHFHPGQLAAWNSRKRVILLLAGSRGGKTSFAALWLYNEIATCGPGDYLVAAPDYKLIDKAAGPEVKKVFSYIHDLGKTKEHPWEFRMSSAGEKLLWGKTQDVPTRIIFGHADDPDSLAAMTVKAAWLDEAGARKFKAGSWEEIYTRRTAINKGRILISTTPYCFNWLKTELYDKWKAAGKNHPEIDVFQFASTMNPAFDAEEDEKARQNLPKWRYEMMFRGMFTKPAGTIYDVFDEPPHKHKVPRFDIPLDWPRYVGLDFGGVNTAAVYLAEDPSSGKLYAYREYHTGRRSAAEHIWYLRQGEPDFSKVAGGSKSEGQWRMEFQAGGVTTHGKVEGMNVLVPDIRAGAGSEVEVGINRVYGAFQRDELYVFDDLTELCDELSTYSRVLDDRLEPTEVIDEKETYHLCFVADTMIETASGPRSIQSLRPGDLVWTRCGLRPVASTMSSVRDVVTVQFSDESSLTGTGDHPVFVNASDVVPLDALRYNDEVVSVQQTSVWGEVCRSSVRSVIPSCSIRRADIRSNQLPPSGSSGTDTRKHLDARNGRTSRIFSSADCIVLCGSSFAATSRRGTTSTTRTMIPETIGSRTSNCSARKTTSANTCGSISRTKRITSGLAKIWRRFAFWPASGTHPRKAESGTVSTGGNSVPPAPILNACASNVATLTPLLPASGRDIRISSAQTPASRPHATHPGLTTCGGSASGAESHSSLTSILGSGSAPVRVVRSAKAGRTAVYNLSVAGTHEYFANGILVSNCDALRYIVGHLKRGGQRVRFHVMDPNAAREQIVAAQQAKPPEEKIVEHTPEEVEAELRKEMEKQKRDYWKKLAGEEEPGGFVDGWRDYR